ncbi:MAG: hypothetical protein ABI689_08325 [Thermoanaerobaculia bacterium]
MRLFPRTLGRRVFALALLSLTFLAPALSADDGDLDLTFGTFGRALRGAGSGGPMLARADGSLRVGINRSYDVGVLALKKNGAIDTAFGDNGVRMVTIFPSGADYDNAIALFERPNGKLLLVVNAQDSGEEKPVLVQFTAAGDLDPNFGTDGVRLLYLPGAWDFSRLYAAVMQSDGKVVLAGTCTDCAGSNHGIHDSYVARFDIAGAADPGFGAGGWAAFDGDEIGDTPDYARAVAIDGAGKIVVGGSANYINGELPYIARRLTNGNPDPSFAGSNGIQTLLDVPGQGVTALAVEPESGRIYLATGHGDAQFPDVAGVGCLTASGALDSTFSGDGLYPLTLEEGTYLSKILVQSDRRMVAVGTINANGSQVAGFLLARFRTTGFLDTTFDDNGLKRIEFDVETDSRDYAKGATLAGGRIVAVGGAQTADGNSVQIALLRTRSTLVFSDGFERGNLTGWNGN